VSAVFDLPAAQWARLRALLDDALALAPQERMAWLEGLAGDDAALKPRLAPLLAAAQDDAAALPRTLPKIETADFAGTPPHSEAGDMPERIGPYRLLRELGSGGMASVWLAERIDVMQRRLVALKLPHGAWRRAGLAERLQREREILATLEHPNIARLYDAGVADDGQPWLALEYVEGVPIDQHCEREGLGVRARLQLFLQVARAVAHAHARLVVHRDIKPANVLVDAAGQVRLLDFGIAKLLDRGVAEATELTERLGRALTPHYAAPEQVRGEAVTTAADVHALGVLLYQLLAGARPFGAAGDGRAAVEQAVLNHEPRPVSVAAPSARQRALRGDLDTIVAKAMKKSPGERYATVQALIDDIDRHLSQRPVLARPDSLAYRLRRGLQRHRVAAAAAAAVGVALLAGGTAALWQAREARLQAQRAEEVKAFIASIFTDADPFRGPQDKLSVKDLLVRAQARFEKSGITDAASRVELQTTLGASLIGQQDGAAAEPLLRQAIDLGVRELGAEHPLTLAARVAAIQAPTLQRDLAAQQQELDSLIPLLARQGAGMAGAWVAMLTRRADLENGRGEYPKVLATIDEALAVADRHGLPAISVERLVAQRMRVNAYENLRQLPQALAHSEAALAMAAALYPPPSRHPVVIDTRFIHGRVLAEAGRHAEARAAMQQSIDDATALFGPENPRVATFLRTQVRALIALGEIEAANATAERAHRLMSARLPADSIHLAYSWVARASAHGAAGRPREAAAAYREALVGIDKAMGADSAYALHVRAQLELQNAHAGDRSAVARLAANVQQQQAAKHPRAEQARRALAEAEALFAAR
jgi:serine/threonine-protein kinase